MTSVRFTHVLLDLDGTLTDPAPGFVRSVKYALDALAIAAPDDAEIASYIGPPLEETMATLLGPHRQAELSAAVRLYRERYATIGLFENAVYEGIHDALTSLRRAGARLFVATSKPEVFAVRIVEHFGLAPFFVRIYGSALDGTRADKRELLAHLLREESIDPATAVMIGDRLHDARAAHANGLSALGVLWGYGSEAELRDAGVDELIATPAQLADVLT